MAKSFFLVAFVMTTVAVIFGGTQGLRDRYTSSNVTQTLDVLLANDRYDKRLRPGFGGPPITITVNFVIKSIGPVSDNDESFGLDCYFRQQWYDMRLQYEKLSGLEELSMSWLFLDRVWKPDTYIVNGKKSFLHRITVPNKFLRLRHDGFITYSMRLTILASCPMQLKKFPLDAQKCPLQVGSYGYTNKDVVYKWNDQVAVVVQEGVEIAQFDLVNITKEPEKTVMRGELQYSTIEANFWLKRHIGYFVLQVYIPCCLMVVCSWISFWIDPDAVYVPCGLIVLSSWVSFWIDPDDVAARVALGVTTVLSLTTLGFGGRSQMPKVPYCTALDWFVIICFTYVFSVMIEYAVVNLNDKLNKDLRRMIESQKAEEESEKSKAKADEFENELTISDDWIPCKTFRSASHPTLIFDKREQEGMNVEPDVNALSDEFIKIIIAHLERPRVRFKSCPNLSATYECEDSDRPEDLREVFLDVEVEKVSSEPAESMTKTSRVIRNYLKEMKELLNFRIKTNKPHLITADSGIDPTDKFSRLDVRSRKNFPAAFIVSLIVYTLAFTYYFTDENSDGGTS